jgi:hypothetical protein
MKRIHVLLLCAIAVPAAAKQVVEFGTVREGSRVVLVLGTGGECQGKVVRRTEGLLSVKLTAASAECGARDAVVAVRESNTRSVEHAKASRGKRIGKRAIAIGIATTVGLVVLNGPSRIAVGVLGGGAEAVHLLNREIDKDDRPGDGYVLFVSRLE